MSLESYNYITIFYSNSSNDIGFTEYSCNVTTVPSSFDTIQMISEIVVEDLEQGNLNGFVVNSNSVLFGSELNYFRHVQCI